MKRTFLWGEFRQVGWRLFNFLFGPPFYEDSPETNVKHALQAANLIVNYTKDSSLLLKMKI